MVGAALWLSTFAPSTRTQTATYRSLNVMFRPSYATWLGWLVPEGTPLLFVLGDADLEAVLASQCWLATRSSPAISMATSKPGGTPASGRPGELVAAEVA
jgi:hypothetical protein